MEKLVSIIVPSYNFSPYIEQCINSIYGQKIDYGFEVIVRDDFSTDGTGGVLLRLKEKYPELIVLPGDKNLGALLNIKTLLEACKTKYVAYIDGDDYLDNPTILNEEIQFLENNPDYSMTFSGCKYLYDDGSVSPPEPDIFITSPLDVIYTKDILDINYVAFSRVFRNIPDLIKDYFKELPYVDWPLNYEISKYGPIKNIRKCAGMYRISESGLFSQISDGEKQRMNLAVSNRIKEEYFLLDSKVITIVDCFIHNKNVLSKLERCISNLKKHNHKILLVSNTVASESIIQDVDYYFYNSNNKLFEGEYSETDPVFFWRNVGSFTFYDVVNSIQKHGLPVMVNLFNSLDLAKSLGYTHFQRIEVDDLFTESGYQFMGKVPIICRDKNKKGLFYFNEGKDISFHYFYSEIEYFQKIINRINCEEDYRKYLEENGYAGRFINVETYVYDNINSNDDGLILRKNGETEMNLDFPETLWNTESTPSKLSSKFKGCSTKLYKVENTDKVIILSFNYNNFETNRKIVVEFFDGGTEDYYHSLFDYGHWSFNIFERKINRILVHDTLSNQFLYDINYDNVQDYVMFQ